MDFNKNNFCSKFHDKDYERKQIGSSRSYGAVYKINYKGKPAAVKIIPILHSKVKRIENEIYYATLTSHCAENQINHYFLRIYDHGFCDDSLSSDNMYIIQQIAFEKNIEYSEARDLYDKGERTKLGSYFMVSELMDEDLYHWLNREHSLEEFKSMLISVFKAVRCMHLQLNIFHGDLNSSNILVSGNKFVIHDFDGSREMNEYDRTVNYSWVRDFIYFLYDKKFERYGDLHIILDNFMREQEVETMEMYDELFYIIKSYHPKENLDILNNKYNIKYPDLDEDLDPIS